MCQKEANVLTVFAVLHNFSVKLLKMFWISWKSCAIACHGVPRSNREQFTFLIVSDQVFENCSIIDKCTEFTANKLERWYHDFNQILHKLRRHDLRNEKWIGIIKYCANPNCRIILVDKQHSRGYRLRKGLN